MYVCRHLCKKVAGEDTDIDILKVKIHDYIVPTTALYVIAALGVVIYYTQS
jgi:hypothetical protein